MIMMLHLFDFFSSFHTNFVAPSSFLCLPCMWVGDGADSRKFPFVTLFVMGGSIQVVKKNLSAHLPVNGISRPWRII